MKALFLAVALLALPRDDVAERVTCGCGCDLMLGACQHPVCPSKDPMMIEIDRRLAAGEAPVAIAASLVGDSRFGNVRRAVPERRGVDLAAWAAPLAALAGGAAALALALRRLRAGAGGGAAASPPPVSAEDRARIDRALREGGE